jgi:organic radical activating enzyme
VSPDGASPPAGELAVSELFESIQGEGPSAGAPCLFLRLAYCNLRCAWCDTKYTWDFRSYRFEDEVRFESIASVAARIVERAPERLVVTGGEPLLQGRALEELFERLAPELLVEIETNGTLDPSAALATRVSQWNVSPKLENSGDPAEKRLRHDVLRRFAASPRAYLKLVLGTPGELDEAEALITTSAWPRERVLLMPQAATRAELGVRAEPIRELALRRGLGFSPRLHVERWDGARGK